MKLFHKASLAASVSYLTVASVAGLLGLAYSFSSNPAQAGYRCSSDFLGGYRCTGDIDGVDIDTRTRPGLSGGWDTRGTIGDERFDQRCRSDLLGGVRCN